MTRYVTAATALLTFSLVAMTPASAQGGATVQGAGSTASYECDGGPARIEGAGNTITFTGNCSSLTIEGASNIVTVDLAPGARISVEGASNTVKWRMPGKAAPAKRIVGAANRVTRIP